MSGPHHNHKPKTSLMIVRRWLRNRTASLTTSRKLFFSGVGNDGKLIEEENPIASRCAEPPFKIVLQSN